MTKKLYRSNDRILGGVCAGIAEYLDFDPVAVRIGYAFLTLCTCFSGVLFYIVCWIVMPEKGLLEISTSSYADISHLSAGSS